MISPLAYVDPGAKIGKNVTIQPFAYIEKDVEIGDDCIIMAYASVLNGTRMGKGNKIHHHSVLGSEPQDFHYTGEDSSLIIGDNNHIRENWSLVQSGCRISKDVPPYVIMSGNPPTYHGVNAVVLTQHHNTSERILRHIANAYRLIYQGNFSITDAVQKIVDQVPMSEEIENIVNFVKGSERGIVK